jgi:hypothetical protein
MTYMNREHLLNLADECEAGAAQLTYDGEHAAEVPADRGWPDADWQEWAVRKKAAAAAAREYPQGLRAEAAKMGEGDRPTEVRIEEAEKVAQAANLGGILIDSRRSATTENPWASPDAKQAGWTMRRPRPTRSNAPACSSTSPRRARWRSGNWAHGPGPGRHRRRVGRRRPGPCGGRDDADGM